ncbi:MAG TPA: ABC transporter substrate-binding protein [Ornithinimicrobium sp.]|uniref:ABC transporter substrate-binding protein n=1 Tax=Ornithinimicrobium sp. TaxID=1977084 RepID=UPI002B4972FB|nr:ABC transporter substrate-binding protein [Ornithinimicrobium sp.]HKJ12688.1 ABC transporter substrate-binding protein [Ornithinimicrobium sp.]
MINHKVAVLAGSAALALVLSSCAESDRDSGSGSGSGSSDAQFVFGAAGAPTTFDPFYASDGETFRVTRQIFQNLIGIEEGGVETIPELATEWEGSEDGLTWTFQLREGVTFHDGTEFNAEAVCANFERWFTQNEVGRNDAVTAYWASDFGGFKDDDQESLYESCEATDEMTAEVKITRATGKFPIVLTQASYAMQSPTAMEKYDANNVKQQGEGFVFPEYATDHPTGTGPFTYKSFDDGNGTITLTRYDDYWDETAGVKDLIFRIISDETSRRQELESGTINGYDLPNPVDWGTLEDGGNQVLIRDPFNILYLGLNPSANEDLLNDDVRQALYLAINREQLVSSQLPEGAEVATQFIPPTIDGYNDSLQPVEHNPEKAKQLLADAGMEGLEIDLWYPTEVTRPYLPDPQRIYDAVKADWEEVGVKVTPVAKPWAGGYLDGVQQNNSPAYFLGWTGDYNGADNFLGAFFAGDDNDFGTSEYDWNSDLQEQLRAADEEVDEEKRTETYQELNANIMDWLPGLPLSHSPPAIVVGPDVEGLTPSPLTQEDFSTVTIKE